MKTPDFVQFINIAAEKLGARTISCSDDFFAEKENLIKQGRGIFIADKYTDHGKWMDGWESRRKRTSGHDWCIVKLAEMSTIIGVDIDTNHFLGNHPPHCSIEACICLDESIDNAEWEEILSKFPLEPGSHNFAKIESEKQWTHVKLHIYPDGGVARMKIYGQIKKDWSKIKSDDLIDLAAAINGGKAILCNDMFFSHMDNLIMPDDGQNMGDGWETKRNRSPGNMDWVIIRLAHSGQVKKIIVDTKHFKGNYPDSCSIEGCYSNNGDISTMQWETVLEQVKLGSNQKHIYTQEISNNKTITHLRLNIFPDGGISRLRVFGYIKN